MFTVRARRIDQSSDFPIPESGEAAARHVRPGLRSLRSPAAAGGFNGPPAAGSEFALARVTADDGRIVLAGEAFTAVPPAYEPARRVYELHKHPEALTTAGSVAEAVTRGEKQ